MVEEIQKINVKKLDSNPFLARMEYPEAELKELGESIKNNGLIEPIIVRPKGDRLEICAGERRARASRLVGIKEIHAIIRDLSDQQMMVHAIIENLHRKNLNPIEEAKQLKQLKEQFGWTLEEIAAEVRRTKDYVAQRTRLLTFPSELQDLLSRDKISPTHAEALARLSDDSSVLKDAITKVIEEELATRQTDHLVKELLEKKELRKKILDHTGSVQFLFEHQSILYTLIREDMLLCKCWGKMKYDESNKQQRMVCESCGWEIGLDHGPLWDIWTLMEEFDKSSTNNLTDKTQQKIDQDSAS